MFEIREEGPEAFSVWAGGRERVALLRSQEAAEALMDALEDAWDEVFMRAVAETQLEHAEDFIDPMPPAASH
jgi:hypothetical protein